MAKRFVYRIDRGCVGCRGCMRVCPMQAIELRDGKMVINQETCIGCGKCVEECQPEAISRRET